MNQLIDIVDWRITKTKISIDAKSPYFTWLTSLTKRHIRITKITSYINAGVPERACKKIPQLERGIRICTTDAVQCLQCGTNQGKIRNLCWHTFLFRKCWQEYRFGLWYSGVQFQTSGKGDILVDCDLSRSFTDHQPYGNLSLVLKIFQKLNSIRYAQLPREDFEHHMKSLQLNPSHAFLTHVHPDHTSGLPPLPSNCTVYFEKKWTPIMEKGKKDVYISSEMIQEFIKLFPNIKVHYSHDQKWLKNYIS